MKPYYSGRGATIFNCDSREFLPRSNIGLVLTDPPYGINHPTNYRSRNMANLAKCFDYETVAGDDKPFDPCLLLSLGVPSIIWGGNYFAHKLPPSGGWVVWDKMRPHTLHQATAELAWSNCVKGVRVFRHRWNGFIRSSERGENYHPTQKPVSLMSWCLTELRGVPRDGVVCDPYMGSGPVGVACALLGREYVGVELSEKYCEIAAKRIENIERMADLI